MALAIYNLPFILFDLLFSACRLLLTELPGKSFAIALSSSMSIYSFLKPLTELRARLAVQCNLNVAHHVHVYTLSRGCSRDSMCRFDRTCPPCWISSTVMATVKKDFSDRQRRRIRASIAKRLVECDRISTETDSAVIIAFPSI